MNDPLVSELPNAVLNPLGYFVLVEVLEVDDVSVGGIYIGEAETNKEQEAKAHGHVRAIGPTAFVGYPGCAEDQPAKKWGIKVGDLVEFVKYEGHRSKIKGYEHFRYIPDSKIIGRVDHD